MSDSHCVEPGCACGAFASNLYRPALCVSCYHTIAEHYPGLWFLVNDAESGKVFYENAQTKTRLYWRPYDPAAASAALRPLEADAHEASTGHKLAQESLLPFSTEHHGGTPAARAAPRVKSSPAGSAVDAHAAAGAPVPVAAVAPQAAVTSTSSSTLLLPADRPTAVSQSVLANLSIDLGLLSAAHGIAPMASSPRPGALSARPLLPLPPREVLIPPQPDGAPAGLGATSEAAGGAATVAIRDPAAEEAAAAVTASELPLSPAEATREDGAAGALGAGGLGSGSFAAGVSTEGAPGGDGAQGDASSGTLDSLPAEAIQPPASSSDVPVALQASPPAPPPGPLLAEVPHIAPALDAPQQPSRTLPQQGAGGGPVSAFLQPLFEDPLLVPVDDAAFGPGGHEGVLAVTMHQPFNEFVSVPRFLLVTPFTVLAVAPHPTLPGVGVLCWERSLLSLTHLATQPLFSTGPAAESEEEDAEEGDEAARQPQPPPPPQQQQQRRSWAGWLRGEQKPQRPTSASLSLAPPASDSAASGGGLRQVGVGVLASFAPETEDSAAFLRVWRAGRRPVARQGVLLKRKKGGWRERAPLGPLAWKRRVFSLQAREILYFARTAPDGTPVELKGTVPLNGWVEVSRAGPDVGASSRSFAADATTKTGCFLVRTGRTFHVFQAASAADATAWIDAIAITAQHVGASQHDPQCLILPTEADALRVSAVIRDARERLLSAMPPAARARLGDLTMDVVTSFQRGPATHDASVEGSDAWYAAALAASEGGALGDGGHGSDDERGGGGSPTLAPIPDDVSAGEGAGQLTFDDALAMASAMGGVTQELLQQLSPEVAWAVVQSLQQQGQGRPQHGGRPESADARGPTSVGTSSPSEAPAVAASVVEDGWLYIGETSDRPQGPVPARRMREWLASGMLGAGTLVRSCIPVPGLGLDQGVDEAGVPLIFLPVGVLFPSPLSSVTAFGPPETWAATYAQAARFETLVTSATQLGVDRGLAVQHVLFMQENGMAPDFSLLLDLCGWTGPQSGAASVLGSRPLATDADMPAQVEV